jgi:Ca2+-binding EF-hand superfamily protein
MIKALIASCGLIAFVVAPAYAGETQKEDVTAGQKEVVLGFSDMDENKDRKISKEELIAKKGSIASFNKVDINNDGLLDEKEFVAYGEESQ